MAGVVIVHTFADIFSPHSHNQGKQQSTGTAKQRPDQAVYHPRRFFDPPFHSWGIDINNKCCYQHGVAQLEALSQDTWSAEEFVNVVNRLLPDFLPDIGFSQKIRDEVNLRLIRHYTSIGSLDEPGKLGKESRYTYRHLLQLLLVRRLLAKGYSSGSIDEFPKRQTNQQLLALLKQSEPTLPQLLNQESPADSALEFLAAVRKRTKPSARPEQAPPSNAWSRIPLCPGLELQIQSDFVPPKGTKLVALLGQIADLIRNPPRPSS